MSKYINAAKIKQIKRTRIKGVPWAVVTRASQRPLSGLGLLLQGSRDNLRREIEIVPEELDTIVCEVPVVVHPGKSLANIFFRLKTLHELNHLKIRYINIWVLGQIIVFLCIENSLCKKINKTPKPIN